MKVMFNNCLHQMDCIQGKFRSLSFVEKDDVVNCHSLQLSFSDSDFGYDYFGELLGMDVLERWGHIL